MKRTTFAAACVLCPALLLAACAPQGAASASAFGDRPPMDESISASSADALPAEDGSILLAEGAVTLMLSAENLPPPRGSFFRCVRPCGKRQLYLLHHHQHQRAGTGRHTHSPPGTPDGWRLGGCPLRCRLLRNSRSARNRTFRPLSVGVVPGAYSRHIPPGSPAGGLWPGLPAGGRLGDRLLHPHGKYCRAFANVRISTGFGGILTVEAKYYYEYIKQFISRRSPQQTQRCAQHSRKNARGIRTAALCCPLTPDGACKRCGTATFVRRCTTRSRSRHPAPTACGNLRTRWPASWKARKNSPRDNAKRLRLEPSP